MVLYWVGFSICSRALAALLALTRNNFTRKHTSYSQQWPLSASHACGGHGTMHAAFHNMSVQRHVKPNHLAGGVNQRCQAQACICQPQCAVEQA
jgi:hypothetical protein